MTPIVGLTPMPGVRLDWLPPTGCTVIAIGNPPGKDTHAVAIVLVARRHRPDTEIYEYATGDIYEHMSCGWGSGHYWHDEQEARADYAARLARGY